jgi:hypothetical protein
MAAVVLAIVGAGAAVAVRGQVAPAAEPAASPVVAFAHIATKDLGTAGARQAATQAYGLLILRGAIQASLLSDLHSRRDGLVLLTYEKGAGLSAAEAKAHPEFIARDSAGTPIRPKNIADTTLADLTNPAFRAWRTSQIADEVALGADGAFIDTLGAYFPPDFYTGRPIVNGVSVADTAWRDASVDLIKRVKAATQKRVVANGFGLGSGAAYYKAPGKVDQLINAADGVQIEGFTRWSDAPAAQFRKTQQWEQDMAFLALLGGRGKLALAYTKVGTRATAAQLASLRDYALGTFLVAFTPGNAAFGFDDGRPIPAVSSMAPWAQALGAPAGARAPAGPGAWSRSFDRGTLTVRVASAPVVS